MLQHPRCVNCHHPDAPLVGDTSRPHLPRVVRGRDSKGAPGMRCNNCHGEHSNNEASNVPGAADWKLPPRTMMWATMSIGDICRSIKNPARNGGRSLQGLLKHAVEDSLIHWAWEPGGKREVGADAADRVHRFLRGVGAHRRPLPQLKRSSRQMHGPGVAA